MTAVPLPDRLDEIEAALAKGTADGEWRAVDNGTRHGPENRYEILDDEGSVAVCSDDNDATATTGADRTALIVAAVNALPELLAVVREQADAIGRARALADELAELGELNMARADEHHAAGREVDEHYRLGRSISYTQTAARLRAVLPADHGQDTGEAGGDRG